MTITKQDLNNWIEREAFKKFPPQFASDQPGYDRAKYSREQYIEAAQSLVTLLLQAVDLAKMVPCLCRTSLPEVKIAHPHLECLRCKTFSQIEAAVKAGVK